MANINANIRSDGIQVFPTVNSRDNGKILLEENISEIVTRITKLNFIYSDHMNTSINIAGNLGKTHFFFLDRSVPFKCNINGYDIIMDPFPSIHLFFNTDSDISVYENPESALIKVQSLVIDTEDVQLFDISKDWENEYLKDNEDINYEYPIGLVLSRMANTNRLKGDKYSSNNRYHYYGVEVKAGSELLDTDERDRLILGWLYFKDLESICNGSLIRGEINKKCFFIIDGDTVIINNQSLTDQFVAKSGNKFNDDKEILHDSDIYGSLMFREEKTSEDYNIMLGFNSVVSMIELNDPSKSEDSLPIIISNNHILSNHPRYIIDLGKYRIENDIFDNSEGQRNTTLRIIEEYNEDEDNDSMIIIGDTTTIDPLNNGNYGHSFPKNRLVTRFNSDKVTYHYNDESLINIICDEDVARLSFGEYETSPIFLDYDIINKDLSINDKLGSIGVVEFCDGQCVDNNEEYKAGDHSLDLSYDYTDSYVPKEYSEVKTNNSTGITASLFRYADNDSYFGNVSVNKDYILEQDETISIYVSNTRNIYNVTQSVLTEEERRYGFYISVDGIFRADKGAYDINSLSSGEFNFTEKSGHEYLEVYENTSGETVKTYNYISIRFKVNKDLYGKQILINNFSNLIEYHNRYNKNYTGDASNNIDTSKLNAYFCTTKNETSTNLVGFGFGSVTAPIENSSDNPIIEYELLSDIITYDNLAGNNRIINIPEPEISQDKDLYFVISCHLNSCCGVNIKYNTQYGFIYPGLQQPDPTNTKYPNMNQHGFSLGAHNIYFSGNPTRYEITSNDITEDVYPYDNNYYKLDNDISIKQQGFETYIVASNGVPLKFDYTTSKSYKSFRIHGFFKAYNVLGKNPMAIPAEDESLYKYYRLIYNLGFENSDIKIEKLSNVTLDGNKIDVLYKLYRKDGNTIKCTTKSIYFNLGPSTGPYPHEAHYFYIDNLQNPKIFFTDNNNYNSEDTITLLDKYRHSGYYTFYQGNPDTNHRITATLGAYPDSNSSTGYDNYWFIKDLVITNTTGINFNYGQNRLNVNVDSYFNETVYLQKLMFGNDDEFSTTLGSDLSRFVYKNSNGKSFITRIDGDGITIEGDKSDATDEDITISKVKEDDLSFNGLSLSGDLKANRVFNAVYNDYADNLKCSNVSNYEPGDIICKDPYSDEYVLSNYDLRHLVVGVYSDTYGHLLGGDKDKSISENSKNYVPVALAGNVKVKVKGFINIGDLIEVSNIPGVGQSAKNPELGTIIGKALETKDSSDIERILMQVMLL